MVLRLVSQRRKTVTLGGRTYAIDPNDARGVVMPGPIPVIPFDGNFAPLFTGLLHYTQPDRLLVEDATLRHTAGSGPVIGFTGVRTGAPSACTITVPLTGGPLNTWEGLATFGDGSTFPFISAATVSLAGTALNGLSLTIGAGTAVATADVWKSCATSLVDSVAGLNLTSNSATLSPLITSGLNGRASISTDGTTWVHNNVIDLPAPPFTLIAVCRRLAVPGVNGTMFGGDTGFFGAVRSLSAGGCDMFNGTAVNVNSGLTANTWGLLIVSFTNSVSDSFKFGAGAPISTANAGATNPGAGRALGALISGASGSSNEYHMVAYVSGGVPANIAVIKARMTEWYGVGLPL